MIFFIGLYVGMIAVLIPALIVIRKQRQRINYLKEWNEIGVKP